MNWSSWLLVSIAVAGLAYALAVAWLWRFGRPQDARALAGFVPDCVVLFRRLIGDPRVPRGRKLLLVALVGYLAMPFDLVPDFIPMIGQLDDLLVVALVLRAALRGGGFVLVAEHWPGPDASLSAILALGYGRGAQDTPERGRSGVLDPR